MGVCLFVIEGEVSNTVLSKRDGAGFYDTDGITIEVLKDAKAFADGSSDAVIVS